MTYLSVHISNIILGTLYNRSGKVKVIFKRNQADINVPADTDMAVKKAPVKPLCPTRWLTRSPAVNSVIKNLNLVLASLEDASVELDGETAATASRLYSVFIQKNTLLAMCIASPILLQLENLNGSLQGKVKTKLSLVC